MRTINGPVVVKRAGFFSSLVIGLFMTIITAIVCATGLAIYTVNVADDKVDTVLSLGHGVMASLPEIQESLPPVLADALNDRREPSYREAVDLEVRIRPHKDDRYSEVVIAATNNGAKAVSLMAVRVVLQKENGTLAREINTYVATPLAMDHDWPGPILPGSTRHCSVMVYHCPTEVTPIVEVVDLRVWHEGDPQVAATLPAD